MLKVILMLGEFLQVSVVCGSLNCAILNVLFNASVMQLNNWTATSAASQVRSLRKVNNDQVLIAIDTDAARSGRFEDEDDDKGGNYFLFCVFATADLLLMSDMPYCIHLLFSMVFFCQSMASSRLQHQGLSRSSQGQLVT